jgi:hypothetical protein
MSVVSTKLINNFAVIDNDLNYADAINVKADEKKAREFLGESGWCKGLQTLLFRNTSKIPLRIFICDDSGSMETKDGKHTVTTNGITR